MEMIRTPLLMTKAENQDALAASEKMRLVHGDPEGNRHERRLAAKRARLERKRALVVSR